MKGSQKNPPRVRRTRLSAAVAALVGYALAPHATAIELETGNPDLKIRWDNQVRYSVGVRFNPGYWAPANLPQRTTR